MKQETDGTITDLGIIPNKPVSVVTASSSPDNILMIMNKLIKKAKK